MPKKNLTPYIFYMNENVVELKNPRCNNKNLFNAVKRVDQRWKAMDSEERAVWKEKLESIENKNAYRVHGKLFHLIGNIRNENGALEQTSKYAMDKLDIPTTYADIPRVRARNKQLLLDMWNFQLEKVPMKIMNQTYYIAGVWEKDAHISSTVVEVCVTGFTLQEGVVCCFYDYYDTGNPRSWGKLATDMEEATLTCINEINFFVPLINYVAFEKLIKRAQAYKVPTNTGFSVKVMYAEDFFIALKSWMETNRKTLSDYFDPTACTETAVPKIRCDYHRIVRVEDDDMQCCPVDFVSYFIKRTIYVGGFGEDVDEKTLHAAFIPFGDIVDVSMPLDFETNKHRGFGFIEFEMDADAAAAVDNMNKGELFGRTIHVNFARPPRPNERMLKPVWADDEWLKQYGSGASEGKSIVEGTSGLHEVIESLTGVQEKPQSEKQADEDSNALVDPVDV